MSTRPSVFVAGHRGLVGSAVVRQLKRRGYRDADILTATRQEVDLTDTWAVENWFAEQRPQWVVHCAGTVGGILANSTRPVDFLHDNTLLHTTVLHAAWKFGVERLLYLGSSCIYPRDCPQPIREESLLTGPLEPTNEAYAIAKIAGLIACRSYRRQYDCRFISAMPTNLYGPHDNFDAQSSHVLPGLIRRFHEAKISGQRRVTVWGSGCVKREFLHCDDLADACLFLLERYDDEVPVNVGCGEDITIAALADLVRSVVYPEAEIRFDRSKPDGTPRKLLDVTRIRRMGWRPKIDLETGISATYLWFLQHVAENSLSQDSLSPTEKGGQAARRRLA